MCEPKEKIHNPIIYRDIIRLVRPEKEYKAYICICYFPNYSHYMDVVQYLHPTERNYFETLRFEKRIRSYLIGRYTAKLAFADYLQEDDLSRILIQRGVFTQPVVIYESNRQPIQVGITHCDEFGAALAFPEAHPMGIDLEKIDPRQIDVLKKEVTESEKRLVSTLNLPYETALTLLWTSKESLSKILRTGLTTPFEIFALSRVEPIKNFLVGYFTNFTQYKSISFEMGGYLCSITIPLKTDITFDIRTLKEKFSLLAP